MKWCINNTKEVLEVLQDLELLLNSPIPVKSIREKLLAKAIEILKKELENDK